MRAKGKRMWARLLSVLVVLALLPGMFVVSDAAVGNEYDDWMSDCETYGYDPYEEYYALLDVPTIQSIYEHNGKTAADNYILLLHTVVLTGSTEGLISYVAHVDELFPPDQKDVPVPTPTPVPTGGGSAVGIIDDYWTASDGGARDHYDPEPTSAPDVSPEPSKEQEEHKQYFSDVPETAWYAEAVNAMAATGLIHGYEDGTFRPENILTQGEWATIVWNIVGDHAKPNVSSITIYLYDETAHEQKPATHWASSAVYYAGTYGYLPTIRPSLDGSVEDAPSTRLQAVQGILSMVELELESPKGATYANLFPSQNGLPQKLNERQQKNGAKTWTLEDIPDAETIPLKPYIMFGVSAKESVVRAYNYGIINGMDSTGTFDAFGTLTRAQACQMLYNAMITEKRPICGKGTSGAYG